MVQRLFIKSFFLLLFVAAAAAIGRYGSVGAQEERFEIYFPMGANEYVGSLPVNRFTNISVGPTSPAFMALFDPVTVSFNYATNEAAGVRIWAVPFTNGDWSPGYGYQPSGVYPSGEGSGSRYFFITSGTTTVDQIWLHMKSADGSRLLAEEFIDVTYHYGSP